MQEGRSRRRSYEPLPEERCPSCRRTLEIVEGNIIPHRCCTCENTGRVRHLLGIYEKGFGKLHPCPDCSGTAWDREDPVKILSRLRIPMLFRGCTIKTHLPDNSRERLATQGFVASWPPERPFLTLAGTRGTGKTHLACGALMAVAERHRAIGQFWPVVDLLQRYRATIGETATETVADVDRAIKAPLLVLDDLGAQKTTDWVDEQLFRIIDERYRDMLPTLITTNLTIAELPKRIGSRLMDGKAGVLVELKGQSRRTGA